LWLGNNLADEFAGNSGELFQCTTWTGIQSQLLQRPCLGSKLVHSIPQQSHTSHDYRGKKSFEILTFFPFFFLFCIQNTSSSNHLGFGSFSMHYLGFGKLNQLIPHANSLPVAIVMRHNRWKIKCQSCQQKSFQQCSFQTSKNMCFHRKNTQRQTWYVQRCCRRLLVVGHHSRTLCDIMWHHGGFSPSQAVYNIFLIYTPVNC